jgi:HECT-domain (ubiquitin-transferase)
MTLDKMRASLKIIFVGEPGVDEGGLLTEMFTIFFESVLSGHGGLFQESGDAGIGGKIGGEEGAVKVRNDFVLPNAADITPERMGKLRAFGRAMVKALFEGRRIGNRLCPSLFKFLTGTAPAMRDLQMFDPQTARSLQWTLATAGVEEFGMHFESVGEPDKGPVTDTNKAMFVRAKIDNILVKSRLPHLLAIKAGGSYCYVIADLLCPLYAISLSLFPDVSFSLSLTVPTQLLSSLYYQ